MEIPINTMDLEHIVGYVLDEPFSSANGFLIKHHFYGIVHIEVLLLVETIWKRKKHIFQDHIHFVEPSYKISKDLHIYKDGKDYLLNLLIHNKVVNMPQNFSLSAIIVCRKSMQTKHLWAVHCRGSSFLWTGWAKISTKYYHVNAVACKRSKQVKSQNQHENIFTFYRFWIALDLNNDSLSDCLR